ncbi:MAG: M48 family metallopeptidase [Bdellovibrionota bacterium]
MTHRLQTFLTLLLLLSFSACMTVPVSGRKAFNLIPEGIETSLGEQSFSSVLSKERESNDPRLNAIVTRVGQRIAAVSGRSDYNWEFKVIDSKEQNAFCLPGGKIAVYKGILSVAKNEAGLATVMSHEVVHAIARHGGQRISANLALVGGMVALENTALKNNPNGSYIMAALGLGTQVGLLLPYSRSHETEADEIGQVLMAQAGYDPAESIRFWQRFSEATKGQSVPTFLSTHPSSQGRAENLREKLPAALQEYQRAPNQYSLGESI